MAHYVGFVSIPHGSYQEWRDATLGNGYDLDGWWGEQCWDYCAICYRQYNLTLYTGDGTAAGCWLLMRGMNAVMPFVEVTRVQDIKRGDVNYMVNPDYIKLREKLTSNSMQQMVGAILGNKMYMMDIKFGEARVSGYNKTTIDKIIQSLKRKVMCYMDLKTLLLAAGFKERKRDTKSNPIQLDLTNLNKDTLINLFS